jgi:hypothetical protein
VSFETHCFFIIKLDSNPLKSEKVKLGIFTGDTGRLRSGWPNEFAKKLPKMKPNPFLSKLIYVYIVNILNRYGKQVA